MMGPVRLAILAHLAAAIASLVAFAWVRPAPPARLAGRRGLLAAGGRWAYWAARPLVAGARALRLSADGVTVLGVVVTCGAAVLAAHGAWGAAGLALLWGSVADMVDGELARATGTASPAGAFLDSNLDRISEIVLLGGVAAGLPGRAASAWAVAAMATSLLVSYARARGEGLGVACPPFGLERPHRLLLLVGAALLQPFARGGFRGALLEAACVAVALGAGATAAGRMIVIHRLLRRGPAPERSR